MATLFESALVKLGRVRNNLLPKEVTAVINKFDMLTAKQKVLFKKYLSSHTISVTQQRKLIDKNVKFALMNLSDVSPVVQMYVVKSYNRYRGLMFKNLPKYSKVSGKIINSVLRHKDTKDRLLGRFVKAIDDKKVMYSLIKKRPIIIKYTGTKVLLPPKLQLVVVNHSHLLFKYLSRPTAEVKQLVIEKRKRTKKEQVETPVETKTTTQTRTRTRKVKAEPNSVINIPNVEQDNNIDIKFDPESSEIGIKEKGIKVDIPTFRKDFDINIPSNNDEKVYDNTPTRNNPFRRNLEETKNELPDAEEKKTRTRKKAETGTKQEIKKTETNPNRKFKEFSRLSPLDLLNSLDKEEKIELKNKAKKVEPKSQQPKDSSSVKPPRSPKPDLSTILDSHPEEKEDSDADILDEFKAIPEFNDKKSNKRGRKQNTGLKPHPSEEPPKQEDDNLSDIDNEDYALPSFGNKGRRGKKSEIVQEAGPKVEHVPLYNSEVDKELGFGDLDDGDYELPLFGNKGRRRGKKSEVAQETGPASDQEKSDELTDTDDGDYALPSFGNKERREKKVEVDQEASPKVEHENEEADEDLGFGDLDDSEFGIPKSNTVSSPKNSTKKEKLNDKKLVEQRFDPNKFQDEDDLYDREGEYSELSRFNDDYSYSEDEDFELERIKTEVLSPDEEKKYVNLVKLAAKRMLEDKKFTENFPEGKIKRKDLIQKILNKPYLEKYIKDKKLVDDFRSVDFNQKVDILETAFPVEVINFTSQSASVKSVRQILDHINKNILKNIKNPGNKEKQIREFLRQNGAVVKKCEIDEEDAPHSSYKSYNIDFYINNPSKLYKMSINPALKNVEFLF